MPILSDAVRKEYYIIIVMRNGHHHLSVKEKITELMNGDEKVTIGRIIGRNITLKTRVITTSHCECNTDICIAVDCDSTLDITDKNIAIRNMLDGFIMERMSTVVAQEAPRTKEFFSLED